MADQATPDTKTLEAKCRCGSVHFTVTVPKASLPLAAYLCHCSICRYQTGAPCVFHTALPPEAKTAFVAPSSVDSMSSRVDPLGSWSFCGTCGCHTVTMGLDGVWIMSNSIFTDHGPDLVRIESQYFTKSAKGGGIGDMCARLHGQNLRTWNPTPDRPNAGIVESEPETGPDGEERLRAECGCGGVSFTIRRPDQTVLDDEFYRQFVFPLDKSKWTATLDVCDDCRLVNATHVIGWTFIPLSFCEPKIGFDLKIGTMKTYESSPGVLRSFCGTCSATFFVLHANRSRPDGRRVVDLATGVLRAPAGVMAEDWLGWRSRLSWVDSGKGYDRGFTEALEEGMRKWAVERYGKEIAHEIE